MKDTTPKSKLTPDERAERDLLESVVAAGIQSFVEVGNALLTIADKRLYRETHGSFEPYCREKWNMSARRAYQLCEAAKVVATVNNCSQITTESQARELSKVEPEKRAEVLTKAGPKPTAKSIREAAECLRVEDEPEPIRTKDEEFLKAVGLPNGAEIKSELAQIRRQLAQIEQHIEDADMVAEDYRLLAKEIFHLSERVAKIGKSKSAIEA